MAFQIPLQVVHYKDKIRGRRQYKTSTRGQARDKHPWTSERVRKEGKSTANAALSVILVRTKTESLQKETALRIFFMKCPPI